MSATATPQWQEALDRANAERQDIAILLRQLKEMSKVQSRLEVAAILRDKDGTVGTRYGSVTVGRLIKNIPYLGDAKMNRICNRARVAPTRRLRSLVQDQRDRLAIMLEGDAARLSDGRHTHLTEF